MRTKYMVLLLAVIVGAPGISQEPALDPLKVAENRIVTVWESLESAKGVLNIAAQLDVEGIVLPVQASGPFAYKNHGGKRLFRVDLDGDVTAPEISATGALPIQFIGVFDGAVAHMMTNMLFQKTVMRHKPSQKDLAVGGDALFKALHKDCDVRLVGDRKVNGVPCYMIEAESRKLSNDVLEPAKWNLCFAKDSGLPLLVQGFDRRGKVILKAFMGNVTLNPVLNLARFNFAAPPDARYVPGDDFSRLIPIPR
ncbi:MAG: hypothetical protein R6V12_05710 [Candidatus Hydrogenedentota bacterium]